MNSEMVFITNYLNALKLQNNPNYTQGATWNKNLLNGWNSLTGTFIATINSFCNQAMVTLRNYNTPTVSYTHLVFDSTGKIPAANLYVIEGEQDKGATVSAEISGLSKEPSKVYGSNIAYYVSQKGTGDVSATFGLLDLPTEVNDKILGYKSDTNKISFLGEDTEPPYCCLLYTSRCV